MALDDILAAIRTETEAEIAAIRSMGEARAAAAVARAKEEASAIEAAAAASMDGVASHRRDRIVNRARLEADRMLRTAAEEVYAETVAEAERRLVAIRHTPEYGRLLGDLLEECLAVLPDARTVRVERSDRELIEGLLAERRIHNLAVASDLKTAGGVVLATGDGRRVVNTFESRRARAERYLRRIAVETIPTLTGDRR
jgi:vacuolar-type H+-ATPase subunit E/Vma4